MKSGNPVPAARRHDQYLRDHSAGDYLDGAASKSVRDIQEIIAKLKVVTKRLEFPLRSMPAPRGGSAEAVDTDPQSDPKRSNEDRPGSGLN